MINWKTEWKHFFIFLFSFLLCFYLPVESLQNWQRLQNAVWEAFYLVRWYAREHVLLCLIPAFFIAGAIGVLISQASIMKYLGARANKLVAYSVASVSGTILAVCSCTVLPLFGGIYRMGAGLGPACTFLYSGPAINVLAIILTVRVLGFELGIARTIGAISFSIVIGLAMHFIFRKEETQKLESQQGIPSTEVSRPLWKNAIFFSFIIGILVMANASCWCQSEGNLNWWYPIYKTKWFLTAGLALGLGIILVRWMKLSWIKAVIVFFVTLLSYLIFPNKPEIPFVVGTVGFSWITSTDQGEGGEWFSQSWEFAKQILPLLLAGVWVAGFLLGRPGHEGLIPSEWVSKMVGGNSFFANFFAALIGAFMYFATLTEVPILQGLIGSGMGKGPALALLLAGPALSLPNMLVIRSIMGLKKTIVFVSLVVVMATISGMIYGFFFG